VDPLDFSDFLLWAGDICFVAGLILMAILSAAAARDIGQGVKLPMQFGFDGKPTWSAPRRFGLLFAPGLAAFFGLFMTYMAHTRPENLLTQEVLSIGIARVAMALTFVLAHLLHLSIALAWLKRQK
jgi:hypothetical protein